MRTAVIAFDSKQLTLILSKMLQDLGFHVYATESFDALVNLCNDKKPTVLFVDWKLENKEIEPLWGALTYRPCVIFISAVCDPLKMQEALNQGAQEYIMKPFDNDILQSKLSLAGLL